MNVVTPFLFRSFTPKSVTLRNRIVASPMCQYSATDGVVNDWHRVHLQSLARGGAGMVIVEATAVSPEGRITSGCAGLWNEVQMNAFKPVAAAMKAAGAIPGIQIAHAGRNLGTPELAEAMVRDGDVDVVMIGRPLLANPHWPYSAAVALGFKQAARLLPVPYAHWLANN